MAAHHSRGSWAVGALLWTLICVAIGIAFEGIGWLVKFVGGTGNLFGWLVFVVLGLVGIVAMGAHVASELRHAYHPNTRHMKIEATLTPSGTPTAAVGMWQDQSHVKETDNPVLELQHVWP